MRGESDIALTISTICCCPTLSDPTSRLVSIVELHLAEQDRGVGVEPLPVDEGAALGQAAEEDVLADRQRGNERKLLVDRDDAGGERIARPREAHGQAVDVEAAGRRRDRSRENLDRGRLARAVAAHQRMDAAGLEGVGEVHQGRRGVVGLADLPELNRHGATWSEA